MCRRYSRAYVRHLFKAEEMLAMRFAVTHNLWFYNSLMQRIRASLDEGRSRRSGRGIRQSWTRGYKILAFLKIRVIIYTPYLFGWR